MDLSKGLDPNKIHGWISQQIEGLGRKPKMVNLRELAHWLLAACGLVVALLCAVLFWFFV